MGINSQKYQKNLKILHFLKSNCGACAIKLEFETEYTTSADNNLFCNFSKEAEIALSIKIGGAGSIKDLVLAQNMNAQNIIAPMIESSYALTKFVECAKQLQDSNINLYFNLETIEGFNNFDDILQNPDITLLSGIVFGRTDFAHSLGFQNCKKANSQVVLDYLNLTSQKLQNTPLELIVGGNISFNSIEFLKNIRGKNFSKIETRKIVFEKEKFLNNAKIALEMALEFEQNWLEMKENPTVFEQKRANLLKKRLSEDKALC